mmetsp:Transcript_89894/g.240215  ORF Transcript_89894/g.240215 Transcript_89894/m.240215 type:complete len:260 (+) Transcript_89894:98-877(+)
MCIEFQGPTKAVAFVAITKPYKMSEVSDAFAAAFGFHKCELEGRSLKVFSGPANSNCTAHTDASFESVFASLDFCNEYVGTVLVHRKDGSSQHFRVRAVRDDSAGPEHKVTRYAVTAEACHLIPGTVFVPVNNDEAEPFDASLVARVRAQVRRANVQVCKALMARGGASVDEDESATQSAPSHIAGVPLQTIADLALTVLTSARSRGADVKSGALELRCFAHLVEAEVLPQAELWHRRELAPALVAVWRAALRGAKRLC